MAPGTGANHSTPPYKGDEFSVDPIIPHSLAWELDNVVANLEWLPLRVNQKKAT